MTTAAPPPPAAPTPLAGVPRTGPPGAPRARRRPQRARHSLMAQGEPLLWLTSAALATCLIMILGLLGMILAQGAMTFWPRPVLLVTDVEGRRELGAFTRHEYFPVDYAVSRRMSGLQGRIARTWFDVIEANRLADYTDAPDAAIEDRLAMLIDTYPERLDALIRGRLGQQLRQTGDAAPATMSPAEFERRVAAALTRAEAALAAPDGGITTLADQLRAGVAGEVDPGRAPAPEPSSTQAPAAPVDAGDGPADAEPIDPAREPPGAFMPALLATLSETGEPPSDPAEAEQLRLAAQKLLENLQPWLDARGVALPEAMRRWRTVRGFFAELDERHDAALDRWAAAPDLDAALAMLESDADVAAAVLLEVIRPKLTETVVSARRTLYRTGNRPQRREAFTWVQDDTVIDVDAPRWAVVVERRENGRYYGFPVRFEIDGEVRAEVDPLPAEFGAGAPPPPLSSVDAPPLESIDASPVWDYYQRHRDDVAERINQARSLRENELGDLNDELSSIRLSIRKREMQVEEAVQAHGYDAPETESARAALAAREAEAEAEREAIRAEQEEILARIAELNEANDRFVMVMRDVNGRQLSLPLAMIVRAAPVNQMETGQKLWLYLDRWVEFLTEDPREANQEGGVYPAIFGTVLMTLIMAVLVVPFGVLAALYLREYAKAGPVISAVRIAINNLAGVPSIVFGVFGLGFFIYTVGGGIDELFFAYRLPADPVLGKTALVWASFTLALLTLPVVIVATEEALAAVPGSMREGSYACGASKWQTIRSIVLPRAMPGVMTGMILAVARGAGEVAPLMLVGAVKKADELPLDLTEPPLFGINNSFMHLGYHIFDVAFHSPDPEALKPMVYTTTLLLVAIVALLNIVAIGVRARLRRRFVAAAF